MYSKYKKANGNKCFNKCISKTQTRHMGKTMCNTLPPFQRMTTSPSLIVCVYLAYSKLLQLMVASYAGGVLKTRDCRTEYPVHHCWKWHAINTWTVCVRLCSPSTRYTQMPLRHVAVDLAFITDNNAKMLKNATYFAYSGLPGATTRDLHF